jgi:hypothetical protein
MKKFLVILLLMVYGASSSGMTLHLHYCCGKLDKIDFTPAQAKPCGTDIKDHEMGSKSCCDNKQVSLQVKSAQDPGKVFQPSFGFVAIQTFETNFFTSHAFENRKLLPENFAAPPLKKDLTHLYCIYRI